MPGPFKSQWHTSSWHSARPGLNLQCSLDFMLGVHVLCECGIHYQDKQCKACHSLPKPGSSEWLADISVRKICQSRAVAFHAFQGLQNIAMQSFSRRREAMVLSSSVRTMDASLELLLSKPTFTPQTLIVYKNWLCMSPTCSDDISSPSCLLIRQRRREAGSISKILPGYLVLPAAGRQKRTCFSRITAV